MANGIGYNDSQNKSNQDQITLGNDAEHVLNSGMFSDPL